ncbi:MAG: hypothetical protein K2O59_10030 [Lachnospiraceae bacterium]|nr:hypothetical protein [Lachnospiraceae bacterium]
MILQNDDYVKRGLMEAVIQNNLLLIHDKGQWFYKKWPRLAAGDEREEALEARLEEHMKAAKSSYREDYEKGIIAYPSSVAFADYKEQGNAFGDIIMTMFSAMPKCGLLHVHSAAALSVEGLMDLLEKWEGQEIYIATQGPQMGKMTYKAPTEGENPCAAEPLQDFLQGSHRKDVLKRWLTVGKHTDDARYIWDEFNKIFMRTSELFGNRDFYVEYHRRFFLECLRDRIDYVELRCGFEEFKLAEKEEKHDVILDQSPDFLDALTEAKAAAVEDYRKKSRQYGWELPYGDLELGVILCARRDLNADIEQDRIKLMKKADTAIAWKLGPYGNLIKGFDFVSEEDRGRASYTYYQDIFYGETMSGYPEKSREGAFFAEKREEYGLDGVLRAENIELMLHAGESLWMEQENIIDAKIVCRSRMGHGFQMLEYPGVQTCYQAGAYDASLKAPVLEVCPISNQMLRYFPDIRNHYALMLMKLGVPCVLSNDDPQILGNPGLSYDFWEMYMASDGGLNMVKGLVFTAFIFQYQHRRNVALDNWTELDYNKCLEDFKEKYWRPFLEETDRYFHHNCE